jgi:cytochrome c peroxidase
MKHFATALSGVLAALCLCVGLAADWGDDNSADAFWLRDYIGKQVGGIDKLKVPAKDSDIPMSPVTKQPDGTVAYRYQTTEAKAYLGKLIFHDPIRTARIEPYYGGVLATKQTGSCASCHLGEVAGKAGTQLNFNVGGEGRGYTDENGNYIIRRRPRTDILPKLRDTPLFPGDALVDNLPTLVDIYREPDTFTLVVQTPSRQDKAPAPIPPPGQPAQLLSGGMDPNSAVETGRLDALDSVGRESPALVGFAFNNRLLLGGFAGEFDPGKGGPFNPANGFFGFDRGCTKTDSFGMDTRGCFGLNPNYHNPMTSAEDPAQENLTFLLLDAHRMIHAQSAELLKFPAFVKLFREAFPIEAAQADAANDLTKLVNDDTIVRATSTFLRTAVTRNTPFDRFLAGDDRALTRRELRGAKLFFTPAANGEGGAGCFVCHSGPMLNKQHNDPDVTGVGQFVEENFVNAGIGDHPLQALRRAAANDPNIHDQGRGEITGLASDAFKFRVLTLRQLKGDGTFFHSGSFTQIRDVVEYFNAGVPADPVAGAAPSLDSRFTNPRGAGFPRGLGLTERQVDDLSDFLENALYDPAFIKYDPNSTTSTLELNEHDVSYSKYRPDLTALGAKDGFVISGLAMDNNDPLTRRDEGLEFLDVTSAVNATLTKSKSLPCGRPPDRTCDERVYSVTNNGTLAPNGVAGQPIDTHLLVIVRDLPPNARLENASGTTSHGDPYIRVFLPEGVLNPNQSISQKLVFERKWKGPPLTYTLQFLSGQGNP